MKLVFLSGETGLAIGSEVEVVDEVSSSHMLHNTAKEAQYLLLQTGAPPTLWQQRDSPRQHSQIVSLQTPPPVCISKYKLTL